MSLDMLALCSERIALVSVTSYRDSAISPYYSDRHVRFAVDRPLLGKGPATGTFTLYVGKHDPPPLRGDTILVLWWLSVPDPDSPEMTRHEDAFNLTHPERASWNPALTNDFRVIHNPDSIFAIVSKRIGLIQSGHPLGDDRRYSLQDFASGRGSIEAPMPGDSEAQLETGGISENSLICPADARTLTLQHQPGGGTDSVWVPVVRDAAHDALQLIRADTLQHTLKTPAPR